MTKETVTSGLTHKEEISLLESKLEHEMQITHRVIEQKNKMWKKLNALQAKLDRTCTWQEELDWDDVHWNSECGQEYIYEVPLKECKQPYCQNCGGHLIISKEVIDHIKEIDE